MKSTEFNSSDLNNTDLEEIKEDLPEKNSEMSSGKVRKANKPEKDKPKTSW